MFVNMSVIYVYLHGIFMTIFLDYVKCMCVYVYSIFMTMYPETYELVLQYTIVC